MKKMKVKSYKTIFLIETLILFVLILKNFVSSLSNSYILPIILLIFDLIFFLILGFEKKNKRLNKMISFEIFIYSVLFLIIYYLFGIIISFSKNINYLTLYGLTIFIIPIILTILFKEHLRNSLLVKSGNNKFLIIYTTTIFIMLDILPSLSILNVNKIYDIFIFLSLVLLPSISVNILSTYISIKVGYKPVIIYLLIMSLYQYIIPIIPNPNKYLKAVIDFIIPIYILFKIINKINKYSFVEYEINRDYNKKRLILLIIPFVLIFTLVYFVSGYFKYYAIAIASNSMKPEFNRGSVVVLEQVNDKNNNYDKLEKGQILAYKTEKNIIVHRITKVIKIDDETIYYTKGDANKKEDKFLIKKDNIIGIVKYKIPYIGYPTIWFSEL